MSLKEGYLYKQGGTWKSWQRRWFVLLNSKLYYYTDEATANKCNSDGSTSIDSLPLESAKVTLLKTQDLNRPYTIGLQPAGQKRTYVITADSAASLKSWVKAMLDCGSVYAPGSSTIDEIKSEDTVERVSPYSTIEGWLWKRGGRIASWKFRYMMIENGLLHYYKGNDPASLSQPIRSILLYDAQVHHLSIPETQEYVSHLPKGSVLTGVASSIRLIPPPSLNLRSFVFCAHNEAEATRWVDKIQRAIQGKDREEGEEDNQVEESVRSPTPREPSPAPIIQSVTIEPVVVVTPEPVVPKRPEKPKKPTRELTAENTTLFFKLLDAFHNNQKFDPSKYSEDDIEDINAQLLNIGLSPVEDLVMGTQPVALHPTLQQANQPALSTPALTSNLGVTSGWLLRQQENGEWKMRWCVINRGTKALRYWTSPADLRAHAKPLKTVSLLDCKWKTSNDENCGIVPTTNYKGDNNDDVFLVVKPVNAFGASKTQQSKLQASSSQPDLAVDAKKTPADKKLIPLLFAAPNPQLRDAWLAAIRDASKDLDEDDNQGGDVPAPEGPPKKSLTGRLSVFASGLIKGKPKDDEKKKEEERKKEKELTITEDAEDEDKDDVKFNNTSLLQQQIKKEEEKPVEKAPTVQRQSIIQNSVVGTVRTMPVDTDSDDDAPPPPQRKPTVLQPQPVIQQQPAPQSQPMTQLEPAPPVPAPVPEPIPEPTPQPIQQQQQQAPQQQLQQDDPDFDEAELRDQIEGDIIGWIKSCQISFVYMILSLNQLFPQSFNCPRFTDLESAARGRSQDDFALIQPQILQDAITMAYQFLTVHNMESLCISHNMNRLQANTILITAEMCAEALDSAFEDMQQ